MRNYHGPQHPGQPTAGRRFEGWYLKHQKGDHTLALIPGVQFGRQGRSAFIQVISDAGSYVVRYPISRFAVCADHFAVCVGRNLFSPKGCVLDIDTPQLTLKGHIRYGAFTPIRYDIMGPFAALPFLECHHGVLSMRHGLIGEVYFQGQPMHFTGGIGYIETDWGQSFPKSYLWTQCVSLKKPECSIMASVADVPLLGVHMKGCICVLLLRGKEYRLATYLGVRILECTGRRLLLRQGPLTLRADLLQAAPHRLLAPQGGDMERIIHESVACRVRYRFWEGDALLLDFESSRASFEVVAPPGGASVIHAG